MTTLAHRAALDGPANGGVAARRAVVRWAWRMFRREWRQQILVIALLTVAVAAATGSVTIAYNSGSADDAEFGSASYLLRFDGTDPRALEAGLDSARKWFGTTEVIGYRSFAVPGSVDTVEFRAQDPHGAFGNSLLALRRGSYPEGPRQVALTDGVADLLGLELGETLTLDGRRRTVVGIVENPRRLVGRVRSRLPRDRRSARHRHGSGRRRRPIDRRLSGVNPACPPGRVRAPGEERPGGRRTGDVLRCHRLPAPGLAGRRRGLHRHRAAATPPAGHACRDRRDAEAPATRAADERRRRRRDRRGARDRRRSCALARGAPDTRDRLRPPHRPAQPALAAPCAGRPRCNARRHRRRLVARAGGRPRPRHARPLRATPEAEAGTSFGDPGRRC